MFGAVPIAGLAILDRPASTPLALATLIVIAGWAYHLWSASVRPPQPEAVSGDQRPAAIGGNARVEPPAVVGLITNGWSVPNSAITSTAIDLAARGWVRLAVVDDELVVVTRGQGAAGDSLLPHEQLVLAHLASRAFNDVSSAGTLAISQHRLDRRWRSRFDQAVAAQAEALGLSTRRFGIASLAPGVVSAGAALILLALAVTDATDADLATSWRPRLIALGVLGAAVMLAWQTFLRSSSADQRPTPNGIRRTAEWLAYRRRLRARIPSDATVLAPPPQLSALAVACVMGVAEQVLEQLPVAPEEPRSAWSEAGNEPHLVRIRYPIRPGYGQHPGRVTAVGAIVLVATLLLQRFLQRVADGESLQSLLDRVPGQVDVITTAAQLAASACWIPLAWALWSVVAGAIDMVATRERIGLVVRTRRPSDVVGWANVLNPFADRDRFSTYLAVDDGRRSSVTAWLATDRTAAPQGAQARIRATPMLGFVRSSEPVGTATRIER